MTWEHVQSFRHSLVVALIGAGTFRKEERQTASLG
jgi:hypothetical protein